ncbi:carbohydrate ABC transporter permease [Pseudooceanicola aestuarii]|uniref:carbohydrate ABC transporter permease n=1 Tax=Pseudooceanicola aestuarii TaxID=2697319 RepID=UPI0013D1D036|nr:sugar ABC transporter permease [Pseudooceanicola aestuarii]
MTAAAGATPIGAAPVRRAPASPTPRPHAPAGRRRRRAVGAAAVPWLYLAPTLVLLGLFTYWPLLQTAYLSMVDWNLNPGQQPEFVGLENYGRVTGSTLFQAALTNTFIYILASIPLKVLLPIPVAVFLWGMGTRGHMYRAVLFLPTLISFVVVGIAFLWILNPIFGYAKVIFAEMGMRFPNYLADPDAAIWVIIGISTWKVLGFNVLIYLAGLASINREYIEAMRMDGAGDITIFRRLIWPLLTPTLTFVAISTVIFTMQQVFTPIDLMTEGGPSNSTTNLFYMIYQYSFVTFDVGGGAAGTMILFAFLMVMAFLQFRVLDRRAQYQQ